ncbi:hypothetical protein FK531_03200 [Rhodococcus spelaei]|uniref:ABC transporter permease n=1 Tax=Rhodococcus spelaei TaxID=2546320 RepID=A0A541BS09_9NOCA|nr:hypothetical protein [Rhodococcus spelaei]TQF75068.1 hypothetical protein FK531_03200 [Rhodococcus spelaei]
MHDGRHENLEQALDADARALAPEVTPPPPTAAPNWRAVIGAMSFPLFFVVMFALCYVSAFHSPQPHHVPIAVVGDSAQASAVVDALSPQLGDRFDLTVSTDLAGTVDRIESRDLVGAIELGPTMTAHIASAEGQSLVQAVEGVARPLAEAQGVPLAVTDHAPLSAGDSTGTGLFYFLVVCTILGYLTITVVSQAAPTMRVRHQLATLGVMSVVGTIVAFLVSSVFVGTYGASALGIAALLAIAVAYAFTVGVVTILLNKLIGRAAIFVVMSVMIFLNFPSAGGAISAHLLPGFWAWLNNFWIGAGAIDAMRAVVYFDGAGVGGGLLVVGAWLVLGGALLALVSRRKAPADG